MDSCYFSSLPFVESLRTPVPHGAENSCESRSPDVAITPSKRGLPAHRADGMPRRRARYLAVPSSNAHVVRRLRLDDIINDAVGLPSDAATGPPHGSAEPSIRVDSTPASDTGDRCAPMDMLSLPSCEGSGQGGGDFARLSDVDLPVGEDTAVFCKMWRDFFWHVRLARVTDHARCNECIKNSILIEGALPEPRRALVAKQKSHIALQSAHRKKYSVWSTESEHRPKQSLCIIIDGMDQAKTTIPHVSRRRLSKEMSNDTMMKTNLTGIVAHGKTPSLFVHTWFPYLSHGSNSVVNSITKVLRDVQAREGELPPKLRVQADNCGGQNKNKYVFAFMAMLVKFRIFEVVEMGFMIVGHTHTDIDAKFSLFAKKMSGCDAYTMDELFDVLKASCEEEVDCTLLTEIADWKTAIDPYIDHKIKGHATPHLFRFYMDGDNLAMMYKEFCTDKKWESDTGPVYWFKRDALNGWAGPEWGFQPYRESPNPEAGDFVNGIAGLRVLHRSWENSQNHWETQDEHTRAMNCRRLNYWSDNLKKFENISQEESGTRPLEGPFWPTPMPDTQDLPLGAPHILNSPPRKPCFVGYKRDALKPEFKPHDSVAVNNFVVFRAPDEYVEKGCTFWIERVMERDDSRIRVKYWTACGRDRDLSKLYVDAWAKTWKVETESAEGWQDLDAVVWAWASNKRSETGLTICATKTWRQKIPQSDAGDSMDPSDYPLVAPWPSFGSGRNAPGPRHLGLINGVNLTDVALTGNGTINGQGDWIWKLVAANEFNYTPGCMIEFMWSQRIIISGLTLVNSTFWNIHPIYCERVFIHGLKISAPDESENTDGVDINSCRRVIVEDCHISTGDDAISIKSGWDQYGIRFGMPSEKIKIRSLTVGKRTERCMLCDGSSWLCPKGLTRRDPVMS
ncbi:hypothetical protein CBR_g4107 [Chara braunii]|uniref:DUF7869 domain-containing protein n=1 Tax=Chara braunii TaxID=69332 RepID=A0A388KH90_CHABU|nr:hypothetical protein CBR_g4107 [Chara braunii]|eukprot:GBG69412.1 hypothetical protein CBR_g4107 [Chara braunii]